MSSKHSDNEHGRTQYHHETITLKITNPFRRLLHLPEKFETYYKYWESENDKISYDE